MKHVIAPLLAVCVLSLVFMPVAVANSQEPQATGLRVSPAAFELRVEPGDELKKSFSVRNVTDRTLSVSVRTEHLTPAGESIDIEKHESFDASSWIHVSNSRFTLRAGQQRTITAAIRVPEHAEPGGHYAAILLAATVPDASSKEGSRAAAQVGVVAFITVKGDMVHSLSFQGGPRVPWLSLSRQIPLRADVANTGTVHEIFTGKMIVRNLFGFVKVEAPLKPQVILPNTAKSFATEWGEPFLFGIYSAQVVGTYGSEQTLIESGKHYFVVVQWLPTLVLVAVMILGAFFIKRTSHRWRAAYRALIGRPSLSERVRRVAKKLWKNKK